MRTPYIRTRPPNGEIVSVIRSKSDKDNLCLLAIESWGKHRGTALLNPQNCRSLIRALETAIKEMEGKL